MVKKHDLFFYFYPEVLGNLDAWSVAKDATIYLTKIFRQTTNRAFRLAATKIVTSHPTSGSSYALPATGFNIHIYLTPYPGTNSAMFRENGDGVVLVATNNQELSLLSGEIGMGKELLFKILHETLHTMGVAIGEYYHSAILVDLTQVEPKLKNISAAAVAKYGIQDGYWSNPRKKEWLSDPMLIYNPDKPRFCWLSSQIINSGEWRLIGPPFPDLNNVRLKITPTNSSVYVWECKNWSKIASGRPDNDGFFYFNWGGNEYEARNRGEQIKLIKVYPDNGVPFARAMNIWDLQELNLKYKENYYFEVYA